MKILLFEGPEFYDNSELSELLLNLGFSIENTHLEDEKMAQKWADANTIIIRSALSASTEDLLLSRFCARKILGHFSSAAPTLNSKKIFGMGRGLIIGLLLFDKSLYRSMLWKTQTSSSVWISTVFETDLNFRFHSFFSGNALPDHSSWGVEWKPWMRSDSRVVGWEKNQNIYLSAVDIFSLSKRNQLKNFGYEDLSGERVITDVVHYCAKKYFHQGAS